MFQVKYLSEEHKQVIPIEEVIENHSIAPIMKVFMNKDQYNTIIENIYKQSVEGAKSVQSLVTSLYRFKNNGIYKICPICSVEDEKNYGFSYLYREHQLDGVRCCCRHEVDLIVVKDTRLLNNKLLDFDTIPSICSEQVNKNPNRLYLKLSGMVYDILCKGYLSTFCLEDIQLRYKYRLKELGYWFNGGINQDRLYEDLIGYYGESVLEDLDANPGKNAPSNWIKIITTKSQQPSKPIWHLLLINYLFDDLEALKAYQVKQHKPFGDGPWPCLNKVCEYYKEEIIEEVSITKAKHKNTVRGEWKCTKCGYTYMRLGADIKDIDKYRKDKVIRYGTVWEEKFIYLLTKTDKGRKEIAEEMGCGVSVVDRQREQFGLDIKGCQIGEVDIETIRDYENEIEQYINENPDSKMSDIKRKFRSQIRSIKLYDRKWYDTYIPEPKNIAFANEEKKEEFWKERDKRLSNRIKAVVQEIMNENKEIWITKEMLGRECSYMGLKYKKNLDRLPNTKKLLERTCETKAEYIRRIRKG